VLPPPLLCRRPCTATTTAVPPPLYRHHRCCAAALVPPPPLLCRRPCAAAGGRATDVVATGSLTLPSIPPPLPPLQVFLPHTRPFLERLSENRSLLVQPAASVLPHLSARLLPGGAGAGFPSPPSVLLRGLHSTPSQPPWAAFLGEMGAAQLPPAAWRIGGKVTAPLASPQAGGWVQGWDGWKVWLDDRLHGFRGCWLPVGHCCRHVVLPLLTGGHPLLPTGVLLPRWLLLVAATASSVH
jgi:hypothetical protein